MIEMTQDTGADSVFALLCWKMITELHLAMPRPWKS